MSRGQLPDPEDDQDRKILDDIERVGWSVIGIEEEGEEPAYCFTVGMYHSFGQPELLIMGLTWPLSGNLINDLGDLLRQGRRFNPGERCADVSSVPFHFIAVDEALYRKYVGYARWLYRGSEFPLLQCVWPDKQGLFPWESGYDARFFQLQRILGPAESLSSGWLFADPPNVATFGVRSVFHEGKPILYVVHDEDDGAWQFLTGDPVTQEDAMVIALSTVLAHDPSITDLADLPRGWEATRRGVGEPWERQRYEPDPNPEDAE